MRSDFIHCHNLSNLVVVPSGWHLGDTEAPQEQGSIISSPNKIQFPKWTPNGGKRGGTLKKRGETGQQADLTEYLERSHPLIQALEVLGCLAVTELILTYHKWSCCKN